MTRRKRITETAMPAQRQIALDTAGVVFALAFSDDHRSLARFTVVMSEGVVVPTLQAALDQLRTRFPAFYVRLCHDRHRFYFETVDEAPRIVSEDDAGEPLFMTLDELKRCAFRIIVGGNRIILEYSHAVTDGYGAGVFLKSLIAAYLNRQYGLSIPAGLGIHLDDEAPGEDEIADAYLSLPGASGKLTDLSRTYTLKGEHEAKTRITVLSFKTDALRASAATYQVTLTALLAAVITASLFDWQRQRRSKKTIRLAIPVNLRNHFPSHTLRNFMTSINIDAGQLNRDMPFAALCRSFDRQLKAKVNKMNLAALATSYTKSANSTFVAALPLSFKRSVMRTFFRLYRGGNCLMFSNLGAWQMPPAMVPYVKQCSVAYSTKPGAPYTCCVVSVGNDLTITLTRNFKEPVLESRIPQFLNTVFANPNVGLELS